MLLIGVPGGARTLAYNLKGCRASQLHYRDVESKIATRSATTTATSTTVVAAAAAAAG